MEFYLGTHMPGWLHVAGFPLCVSHRRLRNRKSGMTASCSWIADSGAFTELQMYGEHRESPQEYAMAVRRYKGFGGLRWAAPQDWMCEPAVISGGTWNGIRFAGTGLSVPEHQRRTVDNYLTLRTLAPDLPFIPVLQGFARDDYLRCADMYERAGVDLTRQETVGLGSVCRRQATSEIHGIIASLAPLRLHGFGVKITGLSMYGHCLTSSDSTAWSFDARRADPLPGCHHGKQGTGNCASCLTYAGRWRGRVLAIAPQKEYNYQPMLDFGDEAA